MNSQALRALQEAYGQVYEELGGVRSSDEKIKRRPKPDLERRNAETDALLSSVEAGTDPVSQREKSRKAQEFLAKHPRKKRTQKEQVDLYDIILSHLLDEGYAETQEQAEAIMVNMSEDWRDAILG